MKELLKRLKTQLKRSPGAADEGWIRTLRKQHGLSGCRLADRLGVSAPRASMLERDELSGAVTIKTMRRAASALDCDFIYALVPREKPGKKSRERTTWGKPRYRIDASLDASQQKQALAAAQKKYRQ